MTKTYYNPELLKAARERMGLSRQQAADKLGLYYMAIRRAEMGVDTHPNRLRLICEGYGLNYAEVLDAR